MQLDKRYHEKLQQYFGQYDCQREAQYPGEMTVVTIHHQ